MTRWEDLSNNEKTALRQLAKGEAYAVPTRLIRRLAALGLADPTTRKAASLPRGSRSIEQGLPVAGNDFSGPLLCQDAPP